MSLTGRRPERLGHEIRVILSELMVREVKDPRIGFVTITRVEVTPDLHHARVYVSILGTPEEQKASLEGLSSAAGFLRHEIAHHLDMRRTPELSFALDQGAEAVERIDSLLQQIHKEEI
jgi:ribosome-binding factor A